MQILIVETNLMWSSRLAKSVAACGHQSHVVATIPSETECQAAIVNLANFESAEDANQAVRALHELGCKVIGHAGHKEKPLLQVGEEAGCDVLVTNGELTWKIEKILGNLGTLLEQPQS